VLRVFSVPDAQKLYEFRRGVKRCVILMSLIYHVDKDSAKFQCIQTQSSNAVHSFLRFVPLPATWSLLLL